MNAKKLILLGASAMLLASCGQSLTRAEAIDMMDTISQKTDLKAEKLTYVKEWKEDNEGTKKKGKETRVYEGNNYHVTKDYKDNGKDVKGELWVVKKDAAYTVAFQDGDSKQYLSVSAEEDSASYALVDKSFGNVAAAGIASHIASGLNHAKKGNSHGYCGFLATFPEGETPDAGSTKTGAYVTGEKYVKNGEGSISCEYNAVYPNQGDEVMKAEWKDFFLVAKSNAKLSSSGYGFETWKYGTGSVSAPKTDGFEKVEGALAVTAFLAVAVLY